MKTKVDQISWFLDGPVSDIDIAQKFAALKQSAADRNIEFTLTLGKVKKLLQAKTCYFTRISFTPEQGKNNSKTIDRVNNDEGYTDDNTVACCRKINSAKGSMSIAEIECIYKGVMRHVTKMRAKNAPKLRRAAITKKLRAV